MKTVLTKQGVPFTMVANAVAQDPRLSMKAKGIYLYLYSKPEDWDFSVDRMTKENNDGEKCIRSALLELEKAGLLTKKRLRTGKMIYYVTYPPFHFPEPYAEIREEAIEPHAEKASLPKSLPAFLGTIYKKENTNKEREDIQITDIPASLRSPGKSQSRSKEARETTEPVPFILEDKLTEMEKKEGSYTDHIASFIRFKKLEPKNSKQLSAIIGRYVRIAKQLEGYSSDDVWGKMKKLSEQKLDYVWTLETILKELTK